MGFLLMRTSFFHSLIHFLIHPFSFSSTLFYLATHSFTHKFILLIIISLLHISTINSFIIHSLNPSLIPSFSQSVIYLPNKCFQSTHSVLDSVLGAGHIPENCNLITVAYSLMQVTYGKKSLHLNIIK